MKNKIYFFASMLLLFACNSSQAPVKKESNEVLKPFSVILQPIKALGPALLTLIVDNTKGLLHKTEKGSYIMVPENAFVNEDGSKVTGEVELEFKEIFTPADIILAGIPMNVKNSSGIVTPFISDGMFTIKAGCNGNMVKLADNKSITVSTPSTKQDKDFLFWFFNEKSGEWESSGKRENVLSEDEVIAQAEIVNPKLAKTIEQAKVMDAAPELLSSTQMPKAPKALEKHDINDFVFTLNDAQNNYPELLGYKNVLWKPVNKMDIKAQNKLSEDMGKYGANISLNCIDEDDQIYEIKYGLTSVKARPVFIGKDKAKAEQRYKEKMQAYQKELKRAAKAADYSEKATKAYLNMYSMFQVNSMGIYNCDRFYSYAGEKKDYKFKTTANEVDQQVFAVLSNNQGVIALSNAYKVGQYYHLPTAEIVGFVHADPDGNIFVSKHKPETTKPINDVELSFRQKTPDSPAAFDRIIKSL